MGPNPDSIWRRINREDDSIPDNKEPVVIEYPEKKKAYEKQEGIR